LTRHRSLSPSCAPTADHPFSVGHLVLDALALRLGIRLSPDRHGYSGQGLVNIGETTVSLTLFKSKSLMNISGPSIAATYRKTVTNLKSLVVITDSLMHPSEKLSVKIGGSANGHNGMKSVIAALGGGETEFYRFRIGIGRNDGDAAAYVLSKLSSHERRFWADEGLDLILAELETVVRRNVLHE